MKNSANFFKIALLILLIGILSISLLFKFTPKKPDKFNVILIVIDALRADHLGCYGYHRDTSPNIDKFAKEGILFKNAFSQGVTTRVSVASIITSLYPGVHKVFKLGASLANEFITLPEILKKKGYTTDAFVTPTLEALSNFLNRFESRAIIKPYISFNWRFITPWINEKVIGWLKKNGSRPFFIYIHYFDVHAPYCPPAPFDRIFWEGNIDETMKDFSQKFFESPSRFPLKEGMWPDKYMFDYIYSQYDGKIRYVDEHLKKLWKEIERLGLSKNTLVILTSDHGEEFQDHGGFFHERSLYDELIHIPLIMRLPKILSQDKVVPNLARHIDIMPTILDILGIKSNNIMQGISLLPLVREEAIPKLEFLFSEADYGGRRMKGIRTDKYKFIETYIGNVYSYELYDLENDSQETKNLVEDKPQEIETLKAKLSEYTSSCEKIRKSILGKDYIEKPVTLDEEIKERLKSLGYME